MSDSYHSRARMASIVTAIANRLLARAHKSINEVTRDYSDLLERLVVDAANGNIKAGSIAKQMREAIIADATLVYQEGMREGGIKDPAEEMSEDDDQAINDWILSQTKYIYGFADDAVAVAKLTGDERTAARDAMLARVEMWVSALEGLGRLGAVNAKGDPMLTFDGDDGKESCKDCAHYKGERHRKSWWQKRGLLGRNGNDKFECGRWDDHCFHNFYFDDGSLAL